MQKGWLSLIAVLAVITTAAAEEWSGTIAGELNLAVAKNNRRETPLVFDPDRLHIEDRYTVLTPVVGFDASKERLRMTGQARGRVQRGDFADTAGGWDELYAEYRLTEDVFLFAGRRNVTFGQAESSYVLDVFIDPLEIDRSKNIDRRRREVEGEVMVGFEMFLTPEVSMAGYHLPRQDKYFGGEHDQRSLFNVTWLLPWQADVELLLLDDERRGMGLAYSQTVGDALLLYAEGIRRETRDRGRIATGPAGVNQSAPDNQNVSQITLGGNYVFTNELVMTAEYYRNMNGYSDTEWDVINEIITTGNQGLASNHPAIRARERGNLLRLNEALRHYSLRQNYGFLRLSHAEPFALPLAAEISAFHNLDDHSNRLSARFEKAWGNSLTGLYATASHGNGEFSLRSPKQAVMMYWSLTF